jgi:hypothetical protein
MPEPTLTQVRAYFEAHGWTRRPDEPPGREHWWHPTYGDHPDSGLTWRSDDPDLMGRLGLGEPLSIHEGRCEHEILADMLGRPDPATLLQRIEALEGENRRQAAEITTLRDTLAAACPEPGDGRMVEQ